MHGGASGAVAAILNVLENGGTQGTNLQSWLDSIWTDWGNDTATTPKLYPKHFYKHQPKLVTEYPAVVVFPVSGALRVDHAGTWGWWDHSVAVEWLLIGDSEPMVQEQVVRYAWALWKCLATNQPLDGSIAGLTGVTVQSYELSKLVPVQAGKIMQVGHMTLTVHVDEGV